MTTSNEKPLPGQQPPPSLPPPAIHSCVEQQLLTQNTQRGGGERRGALKDNDWGSGSERFWLVTFYLHFNVFHLFTVFSQYFQRY